MNRVKNNVMGDAGVVILSIAIAILLVKTGVLTSVLTLTQELKFIGSFVVGMFFVSVFTAAPATVVLAEFAQSNSVFWVAFFGGAGALVGDLVIFRFIKDRLSADISYLMKKSRSERLVSVFRLRLFRLLVPFLGALIVASPLPDELGLTLMGLSKIKTSLFIPLAFLLNFLGIMIIGSIARAV